LIFKGILNGSSTNIVTQAEELNGFISEHLSSEDNIGSTILFYSKKEKKNELLRLVPTESVKLVIVTRYQPENILGALKTVEDTEETHLYLFPSGYAGSEIAVRWAFRVKGSSLVQVNQIECLREQLIAKKMVYSNHLLGTFRLNKKPYCISLAKGSANSLPINVRDNLIVTEYDMTHLKKDQFIKVSKLIPEEVTKDLEEAKFLIIGGRAMNNKKNTKNLKKIADNIGADFGVSRPVAMSAWAPMYQLIGVSGAMTKPDVCIVAGVSGAAAFYAGIEKSKYIVAINKDIRAPIVKSSDVAIIDDYKAVMDELAKIMTE
jgi:electron transfer flavoprotein alpha subunit